MSARNSAYESYKNSGVDWLGDVPEHWDVSRLGKYFDERREKVSDKDYPALSVTMQGIVSQLATAAKTDAGDNRKKVCAGDFAINSRSDRKGSSGLSKLEGSVSLISIVLTPRKIEGSYVHHLLRSQPFQEEFYRYGKGIVADLWSTNYSEMKSILLPIPSIEEQRAIAVFLDRETGKIDELIAKQERMIELLKEKRQAVISHAVTKGLDPNVPMKDSGIEWLGEIPEHWEVKRLKDVSSVNDEVLGEATATDFEILYVDIGSVDRVDGITKKESFSFINAPSRARRRVRHYDTIVSTVRTYLRAIVVVELPEPNLIVSTGFAVVRPKNINPDYMGYTLRSSFFVENVVARSTGISYPAINATELIRIELVLPPPDEQKAIATYLKTETIKIDTLIAKAEQAIELMKERRTALISAAVTGKIDVREAV